MSSCDAVYGGTSEPGSPISRWASVQTQIALAEGRRPPRSTAAPGPWCVCRCRKGTVPGVVSTRHYNGDSGALSSVWPVMVSGRGGGRYLGAGSARGAPPPRGCWSQLGPVPPGVREGQSPASLSPDGRGGSQDRGAVCAPSRGPAVTKTSPGFRGGFKVKGKSLTSGKVPGSAGPRSAGPRSVDEAAEPCSSLAGGPCSECVQCRTRGRVAPPRAGGGAGLPGGSLWVHGPGSCRTEVGPGRLRWSGAAT